MMVLRITAKAFKRFGSKRKLDDIETAGSDFGEWYINTVDYINNGGLLKRYSKIISAVNLACLPLPFGNKCINTSR